MQEVTPELNGNPHPACPDKPGVEEASAPASAIHAGPEIESPALKLIKTENANLKLLIIDLIHENQQLRQRVSPAKEDGLVESAIAS